MGRFGLCPERPYQSRRTVWIAVILLIVLSSCSPCADQPKSSANHLANRKSQSARTSNEDSHCPSVNFRELLVISAAFSENARRDNLNEPVEEEQVDKKNGCACSRISLRKQQQSSERANVSSDKRIMIDQERESPDTQVIQMIVERKNSLSDRRIIDFVADNEIDMILLNGGEFVKGTNSDNAVPTDYEKPARFEYVNAFRLDRFEVSNLDFSLFALTTNYRTDAELLNGSFVFDGLLSAERKMKIKNDKLNYRVAQAPWWLELESANWFRTNGDQSLFSLDIQELAGRFADEFVIQSDSNSNQNTKAFLNGYFEWIARYTTGVELLRHPVVHVSFNDAVNYCRWLNKRLPTENEWEFACKSEAHQQDQRYPWSDHLEIDYANLWQGDFPSENTVEDGFYGTCPVDSLRNQTKSGFKHLVSVCV